MLPKKMDGCTRVIGEAQGYIGLPLRDILINDGVTGADTPAMESEWELDPVERELIASGASLFLQVIGRSHPPVMLSVGEAPAPSTSQSELHNQLAGKIVGQLVRPLTVPGGTRGDVMVLTESVLVGVALVCIRMGGDDAVLDLMLAQAKQRLAAIRLGDVQPQGNG